VFSEEEDAEDDDEEALEQPRTRSSRSDAPCNSIERPKDDRREHGGTELLYSGFDR
jgi:hypothetical protein